MHTKAAVSLLIALFASAAFAQTDRVFHFAHTSATQDMNEIATAVRTIADISEVSADHEQRTLSLHGTGQQFALAEWLFNELDKPQMPAPDNQDAATHEYRMQGAGENTVRVFYLN